MVRFMEYLVEAIFLIASFSAIIFGVSVLLITLETYLNIHIVGLRESLYFIAGAAGVLFILSVIFTYIYRIIVGEEE